MNREQLLSKMQWLLRVMSTCDADGRGDIWAEIEMIQALLSEDAQ